MIVNVIWCDSHYGEISYRVDEKGNPVEYKLSELQIKVTETADEAFGILREKHGTIVAVYPELMKEIMGWK